MLTEVKYMKHWLPWWLVCRKRGLEFSQPNLTSVANGSSLLYHL